VAAQHAGEIVAHREAAALARRGLAAVSHLPDTPDRAQQELTLLLTLGVALLLTEGYTSADAGRTYVRAHELCRVLGHRPELFPVLWGLWSYHTCVADHATALELARQLVTIAENGRPQDRVRAGWAHGITSFLRGDPVAALSQLEWGLESYREADDRLDRHLYGHDAGITCRCYGACARWFRGQTHEAVEQVERACEEAATLSHPHSLAFALVLAASVHQACGDVERTAARASEALRIAEQHSLPQFRDWSRAYLGWAAAKQGRLDEGIAMSTEALAASATLGSAAARPYFSALLAEILAPGRPFEALTVIDDALNQARSSDERQYYAELLRLKGEVLAGRGDRSAARLLFAEAVDVAAAQGAVALVARAQESIRRFESEPISPIST